MLEVGKIAGKCRETIEDAENSGPLHWLKLDPSSGSLVSFPTEVISRARLGCQLYPVTTMLYQFVLIALQSVGFNLLATSCNFACEKE